jgi:hypothetical protein
MTSAILTEDAPRIEHEDREIIWNSPSLGSMEHFRWYSRAGRRHLRGMVVLPIDGQPGHIVYRLEIDEHWRTRSVDIEIHQAGRQRRIELEADGEGRWNGTAGELSALAGCIDVDLGWSPVTNTLPIRRVPLAVGETTTIDAAWIRFPELTLQRAAQTYERLAHDVWQYRSDSFTADLLVDADGLVRRYGDDLWLSTVAV